MKSDTLENDITLVLRGMKMKDKISVDIQKITGERYVPLTKCANTVFHFIIVCEIILIFKLKNVILNINYI